MLTFFDSYVINYQIIDSEVMPMATPSELKNSYESLPTTSAKIRALAARGVPRADIARELGIRYQHVRNVLEHDAQRNSRDAVDVAKNKGTKPVAAKVRLGPDGRVVIPAAYRETLNLTEGDTLFARVEGGEIRLITPMAAMRQAEAIMREVVPDGISLVDELIADRRREAESEEQGG